MLDNGAYEGVQVQPNELDYWAQKLKPSVLILPDCPGDVHETLRRSFNYLHDYKIPKEAMMVLHAKDNNILDFYATYRLCPVSWIGLSRLTKSYIPGIYDWTRRVAFLHQLYLEGKLRSDLHHHALGLLNGNLQELHALKAQGIVESLDSSAPIWRGLHGYSIAAAPNKWPNYSFDADASDEACHFDQANSNLSLVMEACGAD